MSHSDVPDIILKLVERFEEQKDTYMSGGYNETQVRRDFIDPFFKALGWDIDNENGYAEAYRDVIHEDMVLVGSTKKAPDYSFRIGGTRKFFVEAKKPSVSINLDPKPAFQLRRYGWSAKLPISILTDFEEFAVYDCTHKPDEKHGASRARLYYFKHTEYIEKWSEIESLFSKQAVMKGSFDRFAASKKKGTTTVDEAFLAEIEQWRQDLARNILERNEISQRDLNLAVQLIIDRIIFLRICEDRGIESYERLLNLAKRKNVYQQLGNFFKDADDRYNSGLFNFDPKDIHATPADTITLKLKVDDEPLRVIIESLYLPNPYEFSVIPADILGQVYERFLGKVIIIDGKTLKVEEKPEVKKAGGVYYTPSYIVEYIVKHTVDKLLEGKTPKQVEKIKILDPACGSGSFLIVAYQHVLDWHLNYFIVNGGIAKFKKELHLTEKGMLRLTTQIRKSILLNNIYGVDIDAQAVEVTKLSLLLKVLEGESGETISKNLTFFKERALPDLGDNVKCGNSLLDYDFYKSYSMSLLTEDDKFKLNVFDWHEEFPFLITSKGFDCVIGNPPYLYSAGSEYTNYFTSLFAFSDYQTDLYVYFVERGLNFLRKDAILSYIVPDSWLNSHSFKKMRDKITSKYHLERICTFDFKVFADANIENTIFIIENKKPLDSVDVHSFFSEKETKITNNLLIDDIKKIGIIDTRFNNTGNDIIIHLDRFKKLSSIVSLNRGIHAYRTDGYGKTAFGHGPQTSRDKEERSYHSDKKINGYLPEIRGRDVFWMDYRYSGKFIKYGNWLAEPRNPQFINNPKVVFRKTLGTVLSAAFVNEPAAIDQSLYIAIEKNNDENILKFVLGVLTSSIGAWYLRTKYSIYDKLHPWYTKKNLENFPLPQFNKDIVNVVDLIVENQKLERLAKTPDDIRRIKREISAYRKKLDELVFSEFELSDEDQKFILSVVSAT